MRNIFKTSYVQDIRLFEHGGHVFWYGLLLILVFAAPLVLPQFFVGEMSLVFIYAVAGIGLMVLTGFTGLASLGHALRPGLVAGDDLLHLGRRDVGGVGGAFVQQQQVLGHDGSSCGSPASCRHG